LGPHQRVSIRVANFSGSPKISLYLDKKEFLDLTRRLTSDPRRPLLLEDAAVEYIWKITNGHPGAVWSFLSASEKIIYGLQTISHKRNITAAELSEIIDTEPFFDALRQTPVWRSFPNRRRVTRETLDALQRTLKEGYIDFDDSEPGNVYCYKDGWLHAESLDVDERKAVLVFPSNLHSKYAERFLRNKLNFNFPYEKYPDVTTLAEAVIRLFRQQILNNPGRMGAGAINRPSEDCLKDEFRRNLFEVLGFHTHVLSELSGTDSRMDIYLERPGWGIEILKDGDQLDARMARVKKGGAYEKWIQDGLLRDWLVVDFRTAIPPKYEAPRLWRVIMDEDFSAAQVLNHANNIVISRFPFL
ncbi:hypothetical protein EDC01DRAFT_616363, partial [Geopyxis carbonaria]